MPRSLLLIPVLLALLWVGATSAPEAATLKTAKGEVEVPEITLEGASWVCASELARALGGSYSIDRTYQRPVMVVLGHRILLSEETPVYSLDGKVLRLSKAPLKRGDCLYLPLDFLGTFGTVTPGTPQPRPRSPAEAAPPETGNAIQIASDPQGARLTLQGRGVLTASASSEGTAVDIRLTEGTFAAVPNLPPASPFTDLTVGTGGRTLRVTAAGNVPPEVLKLRNPDRLVIVPGRPEQPPGGPAEAPADRDGAVKGAPAAASPGAQVAEEPTNGPGIDLIVVDPGHGGTEVGAEGPDGALEKDITLAIGKQVKSALEKAGFKVLLTRTGDENLPLKSRTVFANAHSADLLLSVHVNASPSPKAKGTETYYHSTEATDLWAKGLADRENAQGADASGNLDGVSLVLWDLAQAGYIRMSAQLAELVQARFNELLSTRDRGVRQAPFVVLEGAQMPAVLIEVAFLSNPAEAKKLVDPAFQQQVAQSIAEAVKAFRALQENPEAAAPGEEVGRP